MSPAHDIPLTSDRGLRATAAGAPPLGPAPGTALGTALSLGEKAIGIVRDVVGPDAGRPWALLDFPCGRNVGDSAIWLGTRRALAQIGLPPPTYTCDDRTFEPEVLAQRVGNGPILILGGGNFGDLFQKHQRLRESVVSAFPTNRVIQLPQSIHFVTTAATERARRAMSGHRHLTVLVRDARSLEIATRDLGLNGILCPDLAYGLGELPRTRPVTRRILWLTRGDEWSVHEPPDVAANIFASDWPADLVSIPRLRVRWLSSWIRRGLFRGLPLRDSLSRAYDPLARRRLARAVSWMSSASVVVTDRLHGHVIASLLGIPTVLLDDATGKVRAFYDTWLAGAPGVSWADEPYEALRLAHEMLDASALVAGDGA